MPWLAWRFIILLFDQFTKVLIVGYYHLGDSTTVTSFFNVVRAHNTGAAFLPGTTPSGWQRWFFTAVGFVAAGSFCGCYAPTRSKLPFCHGFASWWCHWQRDRPCRTVMVDFLDFHWNWLPLFNGGHFPRFNAADSAITFGAICLVFDELIRVRKARTGIPPTAPAHSSRWTGRRNLVHRYAIQHAVRDFLREFQVHGLVGTVAHTHFHPQRSSH